MSVVDLRQKIPRPTKIALGVLLSAENRRMLYIPQHFARFGFLTFG